MSGKIGSGWRNPSFSASSASVSSAPPVASMTPRSPDASAEASAKSILRASRTNLPNSSSSSSSSNSNSNPVSKVAIKLNKIVTQGLFACTSPDMLLEEELLMVNHQAVVLPTGRMRQKGGIMSLFTDDDDDDNGGIEIDRENSLRPAYELYRV
jgi:hypothetical protein